MKNNSIEWDNSSNASIKMYLQELENEINTIKSNIFKLVDNLENLEKDYYYGNKTLINRYKGDD